MKPFGPCQCFFVCVTGFALLGALSLPGAGLRAEEGIEKVDVFPRIYPYGLVLTKQNTLLAFAEGHKKLHHLSLRRSTDGGKTWGPMKVAASAEDVSTESIGNTCPVVDRDTGAVWLAFSGHGCPRFDDRAFITHSTDDGKTWAKPVEITKDVKKPEWGYYYTGPGFGIQLKSGRLLIPCHHSGRNSTQENFKEWTREAGSYVFYSDDHGKSWKLGGQSDRVMDECQAVELADGSVLLSMRYYLGRFKLGDSKSEIEQRAFATSTDGDLSWSKSTFNPDVYDPVCQSSIIRYTLRPAAAKNRILYSGPGGPSRNNMTVRLSYDEGKTWPVAKVIHRGSAYYSNLVILPDGKIGCLLGTAAGPRPASPDSPWSG